VSYYRTGEILGALLDLSIIHDTQGRRGLDDVMRLLYHQFFRRNRGFTPDDLARTVSSIAGRDYTDFFRRYVTGLDTPPFDSILGYAGVRAIPYTGTQLWSVFVGYSTPVAAGRRIETLFRGVVATAGLQVGDVMVAVDDTPIDRVRFLYPSGGALLTQRDHQRVVITVLRDSSRIQVPVTLRPFQSVNPGIAYDSTATAEQLAVRRRWLAKRE
jgi:predicted metalloprotease with PDZ domain